MPRFAAVSAIRHDTLDVQPMLQGFLRHASWNSICSNATGVAAGAAASMLSICNGASRVKGEPLPS